MFSQQETLGLKLTILIFLQLVKLTFVKAKYTLKLLQEMRVSGSDILRDTKWVGLVFVYSGKLW